MIRAIILAFFVVVMFLPSAQAEEFECIVGVSGTYITFHGSKELMPLLRYEESGVMMSKSENKFLDNATLHYEGIQQGISGPQRQGYAFGKIVDMDGDIIIVRTVYTGPGHEAEFLQGTGKYKGITGSYKAQRVAAGKPAMPGTYQTCKEIKGTFELPK